jgi:hypothetical protein
MDQAIPRVNTRTAYSVKPRALPGELSILSWPAREARLFDGQDKFPAWCLLRASRASQLRLPHAQCCLCSEIDDPGGK